METKELRIGNLFFIPGLNRYVKVSAIFKTHFRCEDYDGISFEESIRTNYNPIPLTPEILVKAGFENKSSTTDYIFEYGNFIIGGTRKRLFPSVWGEDGLQDYGDLIEYVHQLQNLYFALTGKELTFDL
jgi:hypothetical protein